MLPIKKDDYLIFPPDELYEKRNMIIDDNTVTVGNYFECLNYADGGYIKQSSEKYFFNYDRETPHYFLSGLIASLFAILYLAIFERKFKNIKLNDLIKKEIIFFSCKLYFFSKYFHQTLFIIY